ncbi:hypothetical protein CA13_29690 [Planctomycetes bacterium CA13]|uniref:Uncharacterized protein n=1 Tax=Novipirellula herctigrandis TaxID=2527986 RepID=A0A5C5Z3A7_9BACT|nr:hypothetical protein CA13_29690 [Planctomycetes bacterium CA13]
MTRVSVVSAATGIHVVPGLYEGLLKYRIAPFLVNKSGALRFSIKTLSDCLDRQRILPGVILCLGIK